MKQLWRNFPQGFLSMVIYFGLTMKDFIVSTVRSITCFIFAFELVNVDVATLSKFNFPYLLIDFLFTYFLIDYGVIALSIVENLIKIVCVIFLFFIFVGASICVKFSFYIYKNLLILLIKWNSFFILYSFSLISIFIYACLVWTNVFMYLLWLFCLRGFVFMYHNNVMSLALWIWERIALQLLPYAPEAVCSVERG